MNMSTFRSMLESPEHDDAVPYLSEQDNNFIKSFPELHGDIADSIPLANESFGCVPEATNIWIGDEKSVSSLHKGDKLLIEGVSPGCNLTFCRRSF